MHVNGYNVPCWCVLGHRDFVLEKGFEHCKSYPVVAAAVVVAVVAVVVAAAAVTAVIVVCVTLSTLHHMSSCFSTQFTLRML